MFPIFPRPRSYGGFPRQVCNLAVVDLSILVANDIRGIILDLDNTIISEDDRYLSPSSETWIAEARQMGLKFFILSNGKRGHRVKYWSLRLDIPAIHPAKKPLPVAFRKAIAHMKLQPSEVVVIGDSLHTDILGAWLIGSPSIQVATLPHPPRWWEWLLGKYVQIPYPIDYELWEFPLGTTVDLER
jgi:HAD superfamily phosphatase (TIGR01668 family)